MKRTILVGAAEAVDNEEALVGEFFHCKFLAGFPCFFGSGLVIVLVLLGGPPYGVLGVFIHNDEFVLGRTAGIYTGHHVDSTEFGFNATLEAFE